MCWPRSTVPNKLWGCWPKTYPDRPERCRCPIKHFNIESKLNQHVRTGWMFRTLRAQHAKTGHHHYSLGMATTSARPAKTTRPCGALTS